MKHLVFVPFYFFLLAVSSGPASAQDSDSRLLDAALSSIDNRCDAAQRAIGDSIGRMRRSAMLPTLRLSGRRGKGVDQTQSQGTTDRVGLSLDDSYSVTVALSFDLGRLAYQPQELAWRRQRQVLAQRCGRLVDQALGVFEKLASLPRSPDHAVLRRVLTRRLRRLSLGKFWLD